MASFLRRQPSSRLTASSFVRNRSDGVADLIANEFFEALESTTNNLAGVSVTQENTSTTGIVQQVNALEGNSVKQPNTSTAGSIALAKLLAGNNVKQPNTSSAGSIALVKELTGVSVKQENTSTVGAIVKILSMLADAVSQENTSTTGEIVVQGMLRADESVQVNLSSTGTIRVIRVRRPLVPAVPYLPNQSDIWDVLAPSPESLVLDPDGTVAPVVLGYSQTVTLEDITFYSNQNVGYVSQWYSDLTGGFPSIFGTLDSGDNVIKQVISNKPAFNNKFEVFSNIPIKSLRANGLLISQTYLQQTQGFFIFSLANVGGFEALYDLPAGSVIEFTEIIPFGGL
jgi:hypothetical protein